MYLGPWTIKIIALGDVIGPFVFANIFDADCLNAISKSLLFST